MQQGRDKQRLVRDGQIFYDIVTELEPSTRGTQWRNGVLIYRRRNKLVTVVIVGDQYRGHRCGCIAIMKPCCTIQKLIGSHSELKETNRRHIYFTPGQDLTWLSILPSVRGVVEPVVIKKSTVMFPAQ